MRARKEWLEWFRVDRDLPDHPKIHALAQAAGCSVDEAIGRLIRFWSWVARYAPLGTFTEAEAGAARSRGLGVDDLIASAFIERANSDSWRVRNWQAFNGKAIRERARKRRGDSAESLRKPPAISEPTVRYGTDTVKTESQHPSSADADFDRFWQEYPRKVGKSEALKLWCKHRPSLSVVLDSLGKWKASRRWQDGFVMDGDRWVRGKHWESEPSANGHAPSRKSTLWTQEAR
jgi:hypothetical protein